MMEIKRHEVIKHYALNRSNAMQFVEAEEDQMEDSPFWRSKAGSEDEDTHWAKILEI